MPWREASPMDQRTQFVADHLRDVMSITELGRYGPLPAFRDKNLQGCQMLGVVSVRVVRQRSVHGIAQGLLQGAPGSEVLLLEFLDELYNATVRPIPGRQHFCRPE
jgi:hypothetical protein